MFIEKIRKIFIDEDGNYLIFTAFFLIGIMMFIAFGLDIARKERLKQRMQDMADAAATAAVSYLPAESAAVDAVVRYFQQHAPGYVPDPANVMCDYDSDAYYSYGTVGLTVYGVWEPFFMPDFLFGNDSTGIEVGAIALAKSENRLYEGDERRYDPELEPMGPFDHGLYSDTGRIFLRNMNNININGNVRADAGGDVIINNAAGVINGEITANDGAVDFNNYTGDVTGDLYATDDIDPPVNHLAGDVDAFQPALADIQIPEMPNPEAAPDTWPQPITIINGDLDWAGDYHINGTVFVKGNVHIHSGDAITGSGALVVTGTNPQPGIHFNNVDQFNADVFMYVMQGDIHCNNINTINLNGRMYTANGTLHLNNVDNVVINGSLIVGNGNLELNNINSFNLNYVNCEDSGMPDGWKYEPEPPPEQWTAPKVRLTY